MRQSHFIEWNGLIRFGLGCVAVFGFFRMRRDDLVVQRDALAYRHYALARTFYGALHTADALVVIYRGEVVRQSDRALRTAALALAAADTADLAHRRHVLALCRIGTGYI